MKLLAPLLVVIYVTLFNGCSGGTSVEAGNPGLILQFRESGKPVAFHGLLRLYDAGSNPTFFTPPPDDGAPPQIIIGGPDQFSAIYVDGDSIVEFSGRELTRFINRHPILSLEKSSAASAASPVAQVSPFNVVLTGDSTAGFAGGIKTDSVGRLEIGDSLIGDTLIVDLNRGRNFSGVVDTTNAATRARVLFVPGTPYYAQVQGDRFQFEGMPSANLPLRIVASSGVVYSLAEAVSTLPPKDSTLDTINVKFGETLSAGQRLDSIAIPPPVPTLAAPTANPPGQYAFTDSVQVSLTAESGADIYYTLDGNTPGTGTTHYTGPILLRASCTLKAVAIKKGYNRSPISVNNYALVPPPVVANPASQIFKDSLVVHLTTPAANGTIYYSLDGSDPGVASLLYSNPIVIKTTTTLKAITYVPGMGNSRVLQERYVVLGDTTGI